MDRRQRSDSDNDLDVRVLKSLPKRDRYRYLAKSVIQSVILNKDWSWFDTEHCEFWCDAADLDWPLLKERVDWFRKRYPELESADSRTDMLKVVGL